LGRLYAGARPDVVRVVDTIRMTSRHRPAVSDLQSRAGAVTDGWTLDHEKGRYAYP
jgi:hypothetical protein